MRVPFEMFYFEAFYFYKNVRRNSTLDAYKPTPVSSSTDYPFFIHSSIYLFSVVQGIEPRASCLLGGILPDSPDFCFVTFTFLSEVKGFLFIC